MVFQVISDAYLLANVLFIPVVFYCMIVGLNNILKDQMTHEIPEDNEFIFDEEEEDEEEEYEEL